MTYRYTKPSIAVLICVAACAWTVSTAAAAEPPTDRAATGSAAAAQPDQATLEKEFAEKLTNVRLVGNFSMRDDKPPRQDSYTILKAVKAEGDLWVITAKIEYRGVALPIDLKLPVKWAGDTPVISVTDQKIIGFGTFTARVMFYGNDYAGTWSGGGEHAGMMWGHLEKIGQDGAKPAGGTAKPDAPKAAEKPASSSPAGSDGK